LRRFFLEDELPPEVSGEIKIRGNDARHIVVVLRLTAGKEVLVAGKGGKCARAVIIEAEPSCVTLRILEFVPLDTEPLVRVYLAQALPKGDKMDFIVQKAVELGVAGIVPFVAEHCVVKYDAKKEAARSARWQKIAAEAAKQCGRAVIPTVFPVMPLAAVFQSAAVQAENTAVFLLYENETELGLKKALAACPPSVSGYLLLVGAEGGFSAQEALFCREQGAVTITMGPRILRAETASLAVLSALMYERGGLGG
jgi:16S rRNA (uracil1498-N3)-methyltransferase